MGGWKMPKRVKAGARPKVEKQVRAAKRPNLYQLSPKWSFIKCDMQHEKWGISNNTEHLGDKLARFKEWERGTWGEILTTTSGRKHNTIQGKIRPPVSPRRITLGADPSAPPGPLR